MKVHTYMIDVMWLFLAVLGTWTYVDKLGILAHQLIMQESLLIQESLQKKSLFTYQIRPPPLFDWRFQ